MLPRFAVLACLALAGCQGAFSPFDRPGTWSATGASNEALAQQVANKSDLLNGESESGTPGVIAVSGIEAATTSNSKKIGLQQVLQTTSPVQSINTGGGS